MTRVLAGLMAGAVASGLSLSCAASSGVTVIINAAARDSMNAVFRTYNQHWNELSDLNTLERMLGTVRPTQREYLGCLQGTVEGHTVRVDGWVPAADMKQLQMAVTGSCEGVDRVIGTWHSHPYRADAQNLPIKERSLSPQDLKTFGESRYRVSLVVWDVDSIDGAVRATGDPIRHPVAIRIE